MNSSIFQSVIDYFSGMPVVRIIDLLLVLYLLYELYNLIKGTSGINIFFGIIAVYLIWKLVIYIQMPLLSEILGQFISVGVLAIIIVFQQEIRKFLLLIGNTRFMNKTRKRFLFWKFNILQDSNLNIAPLTSAIKKMALSKTGALIVLTRKNELEDIVLTGVEIDSCVTDQLIESIFFKNSPLHDGAIIISNNRIVAAKCILPVSDREDIPRGFGLRHRAALGLSETADAIVLVVSEQTGNISIAIGNELIRAVTFAELKDILNAEFSTSRK